MGTPEKIIIMELKISNLEWKELKCSRVDRNPSLNHLWTLTEYFFWATPIAIQMRFSVLNIFKKVQYSGLTSLLSIMKYFLKQFLLRLSAIWESKIYVWWFKEFCQIRTNSIKIFFHRTSCLVKKEPCISSILY